MPRKKLTNGKSGDNFRGPDSKDRCRHPPGRAVVYGDDIRERILDLLWSGECKSLKAVEETEGMPTRRRIHQWKDIYPEFAQELEKAQMALGDLYLDDIQQITKDVRAGTLDPSAGNVAIKSSQWLAQTTDPRTYSNKSYIQKDENLKITTTHINRIDINGLDDEQLDAIEAALNAKLLTGPNGGTSSTRDN